MKMTTAHGNHVGKKVMMKISVVTIIFVSSICGLTMIKPRQRKGVGKNLYARMPTVLIICSTKELFSGSAQRSKLMLLLACLRHMDFILHQPLILRSMQIHVQLMVIVVKDNTALSFCGMEQMIKRVGEMGQHVTIGIQKFAQLMDNSLLSI